MRKFKKVVILVVFMLSLRMMAQSDQIYNTALAINKYEWEVRIDFENTQMHSICKVEVTNTSGSKVKTLPFILYRLLKVSSVTSNGFPITFKQAIQSFEDQERLQSNFITVELNKPLLSGQSITIEIVYDGTLQGYTEVGWNYVRDKIDPDFTILRQDCMAYPELGYPSNRINKLFPPTNFDYNVKVTIPDSLIAVNGGTLISTKRLDGQATFEFKNIKKAWRMDIAISKYAEISDNGLTVYCFKNDSLGGKKLLKTLQKTTELYSNWWGPLYNFNGFTLIEIPDGFGSQADVTSILQTASAFKDSTELHQVYHEISHLWNVNLKAPSPRWEEGLATFIEYLTIEKLEHREYLDYVTNWFLQVVKQEVTEDKRLQSIPLVDFGKQQMTDYSYALGMIVFRVFYEIVGEEKFNQILKSFYKTYYSSGATTKDFELSAKNICDTDLSRFFNDWFYTTEYTKYLKDVSSFDKLVNIYK